MADRKTFRDTRPKKAKAKRKYINFRLKEEQLLLAQDICIEQDIVYCDILKKGMDILIDEIECGSHIEPHIIEKSEVPIKNKSLNFRINEEFLNEVKNMCSKYDLVYLDIFERGLNFYE